MTDTNLTFSSSGAATKVSVRFREGLDSSRKHIKLNENSDVGTKNSIVVDEKPIYTVAYWSIRGLGAPLRMMLSAARVDHDILLYDIVENLDKGGWTSDYFEEKPRLISQYNCPLLNLPYIVVDKSKQNAKENLRIISQTNACLSFLGKALGMFGKNEVETSQCEELLCEIYDLRNTMVAFAYGDNDGSKDFAEATLKSGMKNLNKLENWFKLQNGGCYLVGKSFTAPDFHLYEMLDQYQCMCQYYKLGDFFEELPFLKKFKNGFEALEENKPYLESWLHKDLPFNNCMAKFASLPGPSLYKYGDTEKATW
eukprot:CAMPEP_0184857262 /NCGR_PEP_ID=MMETSP0580-20130426/2427_1 /TAXON_ID=1118495 /ORGANISM="Dactyliosolen fragilissimus" /LENGTH=310 /DNA_ID=CAMNT_0027352757 /DNA_START=22 /DNA_END=951 /DNA_ORIENTATION=-